MLLQPISWGGTEKERVLQQAQVWQDEPSLLGHMTQQTLHGGGVRGGKGEARGVGQAQSENPLQTPGIPEEGQAQRSIVLL